MRITFSGKRNLTIGMTGLLIFLSIAVSCQKKTTTTDEASTTSSSTSTSSTTTTSGCGASHFGTCALDSFNSYLSAYWNLNESSGSRAATIGSINLAQLSGGTISGVSGISNSAANIVAGNATCLYDSTNNTAIQPTSTFALSLWVKPTSTATASRYIFLSRDSGGYPALDIYDTATQVKFHIRQSGGTSKTITYTGNLSNGSWHHLFFAGDGTTLNAFIDGTSVGTTTYSTISAGGASRLVAVGCDADIPDYYYNGAIDEVATWKDQTFTGTQLADMAAALYNSGTGRFYQ